MSEVKIEERYHSLTVPGDMYHLQREVLAVRKAKGHSVQDCFQMVNHEAVLRGQDIQFKDVSSLEDVSSEAAISSPSTPSHKQNRRGPGI